jgi:L-alanine-DL-glutamate epimerase-like enolase superfamily enzyme
MPEPPIADSTAAPSAAALARALASLPVAIEEARVEIAPIAVASYPDGVRPSSIVTLSGAGHSGRGENVSWSDEAHREFRHLTAGVVPRGELRLGALTRLLSPRIVSPYDRAAIEAAAIDLATQQHGTNLFRLAGVAPRAVRYVVSLAKLADPRAAIAGERARASQLELKLDVDPGWSAATYARLAALGRIAVLDFKLAGSREEHERAHRALPAALIEDPLPSAESWSPSLCERLSFDGPLRSAADLARLPARPVAVNVKPARMGGVLEALACIAGCAAEGIAVYMGGMFEVDVGRTQLRELAALFCPDQPNDIAPLDRAEWVTPRPARLSVERGGAGFGRSQ